MCSQGACHTCTPCQRHATAVVMMGTGTPNLAKDLGAAEFFISPVTGRHESPVEGMTFGLAEGTHWWGNGRQCLAIMNIEIPWRDGAASFGAQVPLRLEDFGAHEVHSHIEHAFWDDLSVCTSKSTVVKARSHGQMHRLNYAHRQMIKSPAVRAPGLHRSRQNDVPERCCAGRKTCANVVSAHHQGRMFQQYQKISFVLFAGGRA